MQKRFAGAASMLLLASPLAAQPIDFSAVVDGNLGYGYNPRVTIGSSRTSGFVSGRIAPQLTHETSVSTTTLDASYRREEYFSKLGHTQSTSASLSHAQKLSERVSVNLRTVYSSTNSLLLTDNQIDAIQLDDFSVGGKTWSVRANGSLSWQMSSADSLGLDAGYTHQNSKNSNFDRGFDQYSGNISYLHAFSARTKIGLLANATTYKPGQQSGVAIGTRPRSGSVSPSIALSQILSPIWQLDADVGLIVQHIGGPVDLTTKSLGFHASLCGTYPRSSICFTGSRQSSGSAFGGLRRQLAAGVSYTYRITEHSRLALQANYLSSKANQNDLIADSRVFRGNISYDRDLNERLAVGIEGRGAYRKNGSAGSARSAEGSVFVRVKIG